MTGMGTRAGIWARAELRRRRRGVLGLSLLCALVVTVVLTALAGARRTTTAYARYFEQVKGARPTCR